MAKPLEYIIARPALWLTIYGCGTVLTTAAVASAAGGAAGATVAGFLTLAGTVGYETLARRIQKDTLDTRLESLAQSQDKLTREIARTRTEVDVLKDDMARTAKTLMENAKKIEGSSLPHTSPQKAAVPLMKKMQDSFARMGNRPRPAMKPTEAPLAATPRDFKASGWMGATPATEANDDAIDTTAAAPKFSATVITELLHHAVQHDRIETFAQPIVRLPSRRLAYLELFARIRARAGVYLPAEQYRGLAEKETLLSEVDNILLRHALDSIRADARRGAETGYFLNISAATLKNVGFMSTLLEFIRSNRNLAQHLIFEFQQADFNAMTSQYLNVMKGLAKLGCMFSLDHISKPDVDVEQLREINIRFMKVDAAQLIRLTENNDGVRFVEQLKLRLDRAGISMIVERLENERDLKEVLDFEIDYGEGFLFGKPDLEIAYRPKKTA